ncbi:MAG: hypothetical protein IKC05_00685 [Lentisphaeria bacterium]|nr:hypothetical protein [Lentisphaeria bacterium]
MNENYIIATRPHNALLVIRYECIPDKNVWDKEKYIGAEVHCFLGQDVKNTHELSNAETDAHIGSLSRNFVVFFDQVSTIHLDFFHIWGGNGEENITLKANHVTARIGACGYTKIIFFLYQERIDAVSLKFTNFMPSTSGVSSPA